MITLEIDKEKVITIALVPYVPNATVIQMAAEAGSGDFDKVKLMVQLQILRREDLSVLQSATMTPHELLSLFHLAQAVGKSIDGMTAVLDGKFEKYRELVRGQVKVSP